MAKLFGLTAEQQKRIARVADKVEGQPIQRANQQSGTSKPSPSFWVELTEEDPDNPGRYAWKVVDYVDHEWTDRDPAIESPEGEYTAIEANGGSGMTGDRVELHFRGYDAAGKPQYLFGQTALPFMAMIWDHGPEEAEDYAVTSMRYWAIPIAIRQTPPPAPEQTTDNNWVRVESVGEPFTLINLAERVIVYDQSPATLNNAQYNVSPLKMLWKGHICRVWTELDDLGVPRRVCSEHPAIPVLVQVTGPATGAYAGGGGYYDGLFRPALREPLPESTSSSAIRSIGMFLNHGSNPCLVYNVAEKNGNGIPHGGYRLGYRWGWTAEETPRQLVIVDSHAADPVTMTATQTANTSYGTNEQDMLNALKADVQAIITALTDAHLMRNA